MNVGLLRDMYLPAIATITHEVGLLSNQRCATCEGWGHKKKNCPTRAKLLNITRGGTAMSVLFGQVTGHAEGHDIVLTQLVPVRSTLRITGSVLGKR